MTDQSESSIPVSRVISVEPASHTRINNIKDNYHANSKRPLNLIRYLIRNGQR